MKIWLKHRETGSTSWDYQLMDFDDVDEDFYLGHAGVTSWNQSHEVVGKYIQWYLNMEMMSTYPEYWGGGSFEWFLIQEPPESWAKRERLYARSCVMNALKNVQETAAELNIDAPQGIYIPHTDGVSWRARGVGSNWEIPDLRTGKIDEDLHPDMSGFVYSRAEGEMAVAIFGGNAILDYRPHEPEYIQVKVSCDTETLERLYDLVEGNDWVLTPAIVREALVDKANA